MERKRGWLPVLAGLLSLLGLVGLVIWLGNDTSSDARHFGRRVHPVVAASSYWPLLLLAGVLLNYLLKATIPVGGWHRLLEGLQHSPKRLYERVLEGLASRKVPGVGTTSPVLLERGWVSAGREHLRIKRDTYRFDLYAAPFGTGFAIAWRCYARTPLIEGICLSLPILNWILYWLYFRYTPIHEDRGLFFQESVQQCVRDAIQAALDEQGLAQLDSSEFKPVHSSMLKRWA